MADATTPPDPAPVVENTPTAGDVQRPMLGGVFRLKDITPAVGKHEPD